MHTIIMPFLSMNITLIAFYTYYNYVYNLFFLECSEWKTEYSLLYFSFFLHAIQVVIQVCHNNFISL